MPLRTYAISALVVVVAGCAAGHNPAAPTTQRSSPAESKPPVIGKLGVPLGTVVEIRATVVAGSETRMKQYQSAYLLRVSEVGRRPLPQPQLMEFSVPGFVNANLANDDFDLYELKNGEKTGRLDSAQIEELQKGYVGKAVRLAVYETGGYSGIPANLPSDVPVWQDRGFGFSTSLVVLAERP
jgi:hypothetical protein